MRKSSVRKERLSKKIKESTLQLILSSSSHGLPKIFSRKRISLKTMWSILTLFSLTLCAYFVFDNIVNYLNYEYTTMIDIINEKRSEFPTVTFCSYPSDFGNRSLDKDIVKFLRFSGDITINPCDVIEKYKDSLYGTCYRFNSGKNIIGKKMPILNTLLSGELFGFKLKIKLEPNNSLKIQIHNHTASPLTLSNKGTFLSPGNSYDFKLEKIVSEKLELPFNDCYKDVDNSPNDKRYIDIVKKHQSDYKNKDCIELCFGDYYLKNSNCGCQTDNLYEVTNKCYFNTNKTLFECTTKFLKTESKKNSVFDLCESFCPLECDSVDYKVTTTTSSSYQNDLVEMNIYYERLKYTMIKELPKMELFDLISNIGGTLGLFIGISFLSLVEIIEIFIEILLIFCESRKRIHQDACAPECI